MRRDMAWPVITFSPIANLSNDSIVPGRDDRDLAGNDVGFVDHPLHAGVVVEVGVRVDHRDDGLVVFISRRNSSQAGFGQPHAGARVDDHEAIRSVDDGQSGAEPHLVEAGRRPRTARLA